MPAIGEEEVSGTVDLPSRDLTHRNDRSRIGQSKRTGLLTDALREDMEVVGIGDDPGTPGLGVDGLNISLRLKCQTTWKKLSSDSNSPYDDHTELAVAGTPRCASTARSA